MHYWLMKSEPEAFSLQDLKNRPEKTEPWDGVRNYQARNFMREMAVGDIVLFYHSNCKVPGVVGTATVVKTAYPDPTQFDPDSPYYDPKSRVDSPRWDLVDVRYEKTFERTVSLQELKALDELQDMPLVRKGNRLSVMPVTPEDYQTIIALVDQ